MQPFTKKPIIAFLTIILPTASLLAQAEKESPYKVNGPTTKADPSFWDTPFLWIGLVVFALAIILILLRRGQNATYNKLHKY